MTLEVENVGLILALAGPGGQMLAEIARASGADINLRGHTIFVCGEEPRVRTAHRLLRQAAELAGRGHMLEQNDVERAVKEIRTRSRRVLN